MEKHVTYFIHGLDENGETVVQVPVEREHAMAAVMSALEGGAATLAMRDRIAEKQSALADAIDDDLSRRRGKGKGKGNGKGKKERRCGICNTPGHTVRTCPKGNSRGLPSFETRLQDEKDSPLPDEVKERIRDMRDQDMTTSEIVQELAPELMMDEDELRGEVEKIMTRQARTHTGQRAAMLEKIQYKAVKESIEGTGSSQATAAELGLPLTEVNRAITCPTYRAYQFKYREAAAL